jgi:hypothetical protein
MLNMDGLAYDYLEAFINEDGELEFALKEVVICDLDPELFFGDDE